MLTNNRQSELFLLSHDELADGKSMLREEQLAPMRTMLDWAQSYLFSGDKKLGRKGPVCPFVRPGIEQHRSLYFTRLESPLHNIESAKKQLIGYRDWFLELRPTGRIKRNFKAILAMLPDLAGHPRQTEVIEAIHGELKPSWVERGLMLGQFYPDCDAGGLHNPNYRPLRSPEPLFVMRHMQLTDLPFLVKTEQFIRSYCRTFDVRTRNELERRISDAHIPKLPVEWEHCMTRVFGRSTPGQFATS